MPRRIIRRYPVKTNYVHHPEGPWEHLTYVPSRGVQAAREAAGLTREELAVLSGYPVGVIAELENNPEKLRPRIVTARISGALKVDTQIIRGID